MSSIEEKDLVKQIEYHNQKYWIENNPIISDADYDKLIQNLKLINPNHELLTKKNFSILTSNKAIKVKHPFKLYSLDKVYSYEELLKWMTVVNGNNNQKFIIQIKYDGWSGYCLNNKFYTGGNGIEGFDITYKNKLIKVVKNKLENNILNTYEFNDYKTNDNQAFIGEFIIRKSVFQKYKDKILRKNGQVYKTERSSLAGILGSDEFNYDLKDLLELVIYNNEDGYEISYNDFVKNGKEIFEKFGEWFKNHIYSDYPSDGLVIKLADEEYSKQLRCNNLFPGGKIAYKFDNPSGISSIKDIEWFVGKNRTLNPVGILEPVEIEGHTITKVNLHNVQYVKTLDLHFNDLVKIERCGMIIPNLTKVIERYKDGKSIPIPEKCPGCGSKTHEDGQFLYCSNPNCGNSLIKKLTDTVKKLDIKNLGESTIKKIVEDGLAINIYEILNLKYDDIIQLDGFAETSAYNLSEELHFALMKVYPDWNLLSMLGLIGFSDNLCKQICKKYSLYELLDFDPDNEEFEVTGFSSIRTEQFFDQLTENADLLIKLIHNLHFEHTKEIGEEEKQTICFTGKMPQPRSYYENIAVQRGLTPVNTVTKDLGILVSEEPNSSKTKKAQKYNITIISLEEFLVG